MGLPPSATWRSVTRTAGVVLATAQSSLQDVEIAVHDDEVVVSLLDEASDGVQGSDLQARIVGKRLDDAWIDEGLNEDGGGSDGLGKGANLTDTGGRARPLG